MKNTITFSKIEEVESFKRCVLMIHARVKRLAQENDKVILDTPIEQIEKLTLPIYTVFYDGDLFHDDLSQFSTLTYKLIKGHYFTDGNKRTALGVLLFCLHANGYNVVYEDNSEFSKNILAQSIINLATDAISISDFTELLYDICKE